MTLPPLPKAERIEAAQFCDDAYWFSAEQMCEYGKQCVAAYTALLRQAENDLHMVRGGYGKVLHENDKQRLDKTISAIWGRLREQT